MSNSIILLAPQFLHDLLCLTKSAQLAQDFIDLAPDCRSMVTGCTKIIKIGVFTVDETGGSLLVSFLVSC